MSKFYKFPIRNWILKKDFDEIANDLKSIIELMDRVVGKISYQLIIHDRFINLLAISDEYHVTLSSYLCSLCPHVDILSLFTYLKTTQIRVFYSDPCEITVIIGTGKIS